MFQNLKQLIFKFDKKIISKNIIFKYNLIFIHHFLNFHNKYFFKKITIVKIKRAKRIL